MIGFGLLGGAAGTVIALAIVAFLVPPHAVLPAFVIGWFFGTAGALGGIYYGTVRA